VSEALASFQKRNFFRNLWLTSDFHRSIGFTVIFPACKLLFDNMQRAERGHDKYMEMEHSLCTITRVRVPISV